MRCSPVSGRWLREQRDEWLEAMALTSICGLGQAAPIPVRSALRHWPELVEEPLA